MCHLCCIRVVSHHEQIVTLRINRLVMPTTRWVLRNVSPHQVSKHYSLARRKTTRCRTATHTREYCKIIRLAAKPPLGLAPRNRHLRASNLTDAYAFWWHHLFRKPNAKDSHCWPKSAQALCVRKPRVALNYWCTKWRLTLRSTGTPKQLASPAVWAPVTLNVMQPKKTKKWHLPE